MLEIFSRYRPRFVRSLVYMLQASEYHPGEYLRWYHRTSDFAHVEKRKKLDKTLKARTLLTLTWIMVIVWVIGIFAYAAYTRSDVPLVVALGLTFLVPFYLPYIMLVPLLVLNLVQKPFEARIVRKAKRKLNEHRGIKIAIAGSFGKTTMREILKTVLSAGKTVAAPPGSYNTPLGLSKFIDTLAGDEDVIIFELGEYYPGDVRRLCEFVEPDAGIITGVNEAHLEKFGSLEKTAATIFELRDYLGETPVYINAESAPAKELAREKDLLFSREGVDGWRVVSPRSDLKGTQFTLVRGQEIIRVSSQLLGLHMVGVLAVAADIARGLELTVSQIEEGMRQTKAFAHRLQPIIDNTGVVTLDDSYNGNPDGAFAVIDFLASVTGHRRYFITPGLVEMGTRTEAVHVDIGKRLAEARIERVILIKDSVTPFIETGLKERGFKGELFWYDSMPEALAAVHHMTASGDIVLIQNDWPDQYA